MTNPNYQPSVLPLQSFGLGDIIFTQTIFRIKYGKSKIIWPVEPGYEKALNAAYPGVTFIDKRLVNINFDIREFTTLEDMLIVPLRFSDSIMKVPYSDCMKSKYMMFDLDWNLWKEFAMWRRNTAKEIQLAKDLRIEPREQFTLVNRTFKNDCSGKIDIPIEGGRVIEMKPIPGYSLFDWAYVLSIATEIHTVSSSIIFVLEMLRLKANNISIYVRRPQERNHDNYQYLLQKHNYNLIP